MKSLARSATVIGLWGLAWLAAGNAQASQSPPAQFHYHYISLNAAKPAGCDLFDPYKLTNSDRVYRTLYPFPCDNTDCPVVAAVYFQGTMTILQKGFAYAANESETVGGSLLFDPFFDPITGALHRQAALFKGSKVERIPFLPGEVASDVRMLTDSGIAEVDPIDKDGYELPPHLYKNGQTIPLALGPGGLNNNGQVAGTLDLPGSGHQRAFRFDPVTGTTTILNPVPPDTNSWGVDIDDKDDVLGMSWIYYAGGHERIGVWNKKGIFTPYLVQENFANSYSLLRNSQGLIVATNSNDNNSYIIPRPGVSLNLADLVDVSPFTYSDIYDINDNGDMMGVRASCNFCLGDTFLLQRVDGPLSPGLQFAETPTCS